MKSAPKGKRLRVSAGAGSAILAAAFALGAADARGALAPPAFNPPADLFNNRGLFLPYVRAFTGPMQAAAVAVGDLDADGRLDVALTTSAPEGYPPDPELDHRLFVFSQQDNGTLSVPVSYPVPRASASYQPNAVSIGDLNHDGRNDVAVPTGGGVGVFLQNASGGLDPMRTHASGRQASSNVAMIAIGDLNRDGLQDVAALDYGTSSRIVEVFLQTAAGTLAPPEAYPVQHGGYDDLAIGDVNGDGRADLIVMSGQFHDYPDLAVLPQRADGTLGPAVSYDLEGEEIVNSLALGDVNGDGREDVVLSARTSQALAVLLQDASGALTTPPVMKPTLWFSGRALVADVDGDGRKDAILGGATCILDVFLQGGDGALAEQDSSLTSYLGRWDSHGIAFGDVNGDGVGDVVIATMAYCQGADCGMARMSSDLGVSYGAPIRLSPASWDFGLVPPGSVSASQTFSVLNVSSASLAIDAIDVARAVYNPGLVGIFRIQNDGCSWTTLQPGDACTLQAVFAPVKDTDVEENGNIVIPFSLKGISYVQRRPLRGNR